MLRFSLISLGLVCAIVWAAPVDEKSPIPTLKGVTILNEPYVTLKNNPDGSLYGGYAVDLLKYLAKEVGFNYELYLSPDSAYGTRRKDGSWNGMIGEVQNGKADFALADLTITEMRSEAVDFTTPFKDSGLAALVNRKHAAGMKTLKDLAGKKDLPVGVLSSGSTNAFLVSSPHDTAKSLYQRIQANPSTNYVASNSDGFSRVISGFPYAYLAVSDSVKYVAGKYSGEVKMLVDDENMAPRGYGIALPKGSPYLAKFNEAIQKWRDSGEAKKTEDKYWKPIE